MSKHVYAYIVALHGMHAFHIRICPVDCGEQCFVQFDPVENPAQVEVDNIWLSIWCLCNQYLRD